MWCGRGLFIKKNFFAMAEALVTLGTTEKNDESPKDPNVNVKKRSACKCDEILLASLIPAFVGVLLLINHV